MFCLFIVLLSFVVSAQTYLNIMKRDGTIEYESINSIRKLIFTQDSDSLLVFLKTGLVISVPVNNIQNFTFGPKGLGNLLSAANNNVVTTPARFELHQNYPNPFNPTTTIAFTLPKKGMVNLIVYDILGRELVKLVNEELLAGWYSRLFDASKMASGVYVYNLRMGGLRLSKKMMVIK